VIEDALAQRSFPCVCELDFEERATKGKVTLVCTAIRAKVVDQMQRKAA
jgi:hypothetical protein